MTPSVANAEYAKELRAHADRIRQRFYRRDINGEIVTLIRNGDWDKVDEDAFSEAFPRPIVANDVDSMARGGVAALSVMPTFRCQTAVNGASEAQKKRSQKRTDIVNHYIENANLAQQMQTGADHLISYGMVVTQIYIDAVNKMPVPVVRDSLGFYPVWDMLGRTREVVHVFRKRIIELMAEYPELIPEFDKYNAGVTQTQSEVNEVEVYHHDDGKTITLFVPACHDLILTRFDNPIGECLFVCTKRETLDGMVHGVFDDAVWVQLAENHMQMLMIQGTAKAVDAPITAPNDVTEVPIGPDALLKSSQSEKIRRLDLNLPNGVYTAVQSFKADLQSSALSGDPAQVDASVITGKGMQELMAGYSQQIAVLQATLQVHYRKIAELCFHVDEVLWPDTEKYIEGYREGNEYELHYTPAKDIRGNYKVDVSFGTSTGLDPNRHLIYLLQAMGAKLFSKDTVIRALPGNVNADDEMRKIDIEQGREAISMAIAAYANAIAGMAAQGADPSKAVQQVGQYVHFVQRGATPEEAIAKVFPPPEPQAAPQAPPGAPAAPGQEDIGGQNALQQLQLGQSPADDLQMMMAGIGPGGSPQLGAMVSRRAPAA